MFKKGSVLRKILISVAVAFLVVVGLLIIVPMISHIGETTTALDAIEGYDKATGLDMTEEYKKLGKEERVEMVEQMRDLVSKQEQLSENKKGLTDNLWEDNTVIVCIADTKEDILKAYEEIDKLELGERKYVVISRSDEEGMGVLKKQYSKLDVEKSHGFYWKNGAVAKEFETKKWENEIPDI